MVLPREGESEGVTLGDIEKKGVGWTVGTQYIKILKKKSREKPSL